MLAPATLAPSQAGTWSVCLYLAYTAITYTFFNPSESLNLTKLALGLCRIVRGSVWH